MIADSATEAELVFTNRAHDGQTGMGNDYPSGRNSEKVTTEEKARREA